MPNSHRIPINYTFYFTIDGSLFGKVLVGNIIDSQELLAESVWDFNVPNVVVFPDQLTWGAKKFMFKYAARAIPADVSRYIRSLIHLIYVAWCWNVQVQWYWCQPLSASQTWRFRLESCSCSQSQNKMGRKEVQTTLVSSLTVTHGSKMARRTNYGIVGLDLFARQAKTRRNAWFG